MICILHIHFQLYCFLTIRACWCYLIAAAPARMASSWRERCGASEEGSGVGEGYRGAEGREMINDDHRDDGPRWLAKLTEA